MKQHSDEQLMRRIQEGDQTAFNALVNQHINPLYHFTKRMLGNNTDAEDIVQETFLRAWKHALSWQPNKAKLSTWLHRIAHNLCIDMSRKQRMKLVELQEDHVITERQVSDDIHQEEVSAQVADALHGLPERQRSAIILCYYQGLSNQQAAEILDVSVSALESLLARGRRSLKTRLHAPDDV